MVRTLIMISLAAAACLFLACSSVPEGTDESPVNTLESETFEVHGAVVRDGAPVPNVRIDLQMNYLGDGWLNTGYYTYTNAKGAYSITYVTTQHLGGDFFRIEAYDGGSYRDSDPFKPSNGESWEIRIIW